MTQIQSTMNYDLFQFIDCNRKINPNHVHVFTTDPTFPDQFEFHPIIVNEKMQVIDGQHRLEAAKTLEIPVHYVVQKGADYKTIKNINVNQKPWRAEDYLLFYSHENKDFQFMKEMKDLFNVGVDFVLSTVSAIEDIPRHLISGQFKRGSIKIKNKQTIRDFLQSFLPILKETRKNSGYEIQHLFGRMYAYEFAYIFKNNIYGYKRLVHLLPTYYKKLPYCSCQPDCREKILNLAKYNTKKTNECNIE